LAVAQKARLLGLEVKALDLAALKKLEPNVKLDVKGAIHYECDRHTTPTEFMPKMLNHLLNAGVIIQTNEEVLDISTSSDLITEIKTSTASYTADEVVLAAGSWSGKISKQLAINLPLQAGKGYSINVKKPTGISIPAVLMEAKAAVTPMQGFTRFAGTMEFSGINDAIRKERVEAIAKAANSYYPEIEISREDKSNAKSGLRPVSPDGLPYIGRSKSCSNLVFATGHAMMGWSLGPATGILVSEIIEGKNTAMDIEPFNPDRKF